MKEKLIILLTILSLYSCNDKEIIPEIQDKWRIIKTEKFDIFIFNGKSLDGYPVIYIDTTYIYDNNFNKYASKYMDDRSHGILFKDGIEYEYRGEISYKILKMENEK